MARQFNETYKADDIAKVPTIPNEKNMKLFGDVVIEELQELALAHHTKDPVEFLDAIADVIYGTAQQAHLNGWPIGEALSRVHSSNMSKLGEDGLPIIREDGKVLKGPNFKAPDLKDLVEDCFIQPEETESDEESV
jgi:predicted HAD superfamily Cof-like phosphohydrolase